MTWILLAAWAAASLAAGYPVASLALSKESRRSVLICYGILAGHAFQTLVLLLTWSLVPLGPAYFASLGASLLAGSLLLWLSRPETTRSERSWGMPWPDTLIVSAMLSVFGLLGHRVFTVGYSGWSAEALYRHSGLVSWLQHGTYPPTNPLEPDDPLMYRFGLNALAASISSNSGAPAPEVLAATVGFLLPTMVLALVGVSIRTTASPRTGMLAALLALFGGSLYPIYRVIQLTLGDPAADWRPNEIIGGLLFTGNTLNAIHSNVSLAAGFVAFTASVWLCWEAVAPQNRAWWAGAAAAISLGTLGLVAEVHFSILVAGIVAIVGVRYVRSFRGDVPALRGSLVALVVVTTACLIVASRGGLLGGIGFSGDTSNSLKLVINTTHFGEVVSPPGNAAGHWYPLLSADTFIDSAAMVLGLPVLAVAALLVHSGPATLGLLTGSVSMVLWLTVYPRAAPYDAYRFGQIALVTYVTYAPFVLRMVPARLTFMGRRLGFVLATVTVVAVTLMNVVIAGYLTLTPAPPTWVATGNADREASEYLTHSSGTRRVLVLTQGEGDLSQSLYGNEPAAVAIRTILGYSGHSIPIGDGAAYWNPGTYRETYAHADSFLDETSLSRLRVDWVYVLPTHLGEAQRVNLRTAIHEGRLHLAKTFGEPGTTEERWLFARNNVRP